MESCIDSNSISLCVENLGFQYPKKDFLFKSINFTVRAGESLCVLGAPMAGKTTMTRLLSGYLSPTEGMVKGQGSKVVALSPIVSPAEFITLSEYIIYKISEFDFEGDYPLDLLDICQLTNKKGMQLRLLSPAIRLRVSLALLFSSKPKIIILDSVPGGRDTETQLIVNKLYRNFLNEGGIVVFTSRKKPSQKITTMIVDIN